MLCVKDGLNKTEISSTSSLVNFLNFNVPQHCKTTLETAGNSLRGVVGRKLLATFYMHKFEYSSKLLF